ncbi:hypothetical protein FOE78_23050 [Microlunatus elymi]|uniref:Uncharacterized protein n=1 Tax=Microlunatus elymi TaxID=2596828 RepID=A0A516Q4N2_9ACTN|nr:hypothetical protein [Microlunatus elymi]QDP98396.1 hypothetical protein FOE78_23050 [Microlunatus elymi]
MTQNPAGRSHRSIVGRVAGLVLIVLGGVPMLFTLSLAIRSAIGDASSDPHGYGLIFGSFLAILFAIPTLLGALLLVFSVRNRSKDRVQT